MPPSQIGSVWLERQGEEVLAFSTICPHLGCGIDWESGKKRYVCPCHDSYFAPDGSVLTGPSPRGMDRLEARIVEGQVEVKFEKFVLGTAEKTPA
jgi:Rieske Fe-S protein